MLLQAISINNALHVLFHIQKQVHIRRIESMWWQVKHTLPETNSRHGGLLLMFREYLYRRRYRDEPQFFSFIYITVPLSTYQSNS